MDMHRAPPTGNLRRRGGRIADDDVHPAMKVYIPDTLRSYTGDRRTVDAQGATLAALMLDLERQFPGIRFRMVDEQDAIRRHMRVFVNGEEARALDITLADRDDISIVQALSGG